MRHSHIALALLLSLPACVDEVATEEIAAEAEDIEIGEVGDLPDYFPLCTGVEADATLYVGNGYNIPVSALPYTQKSANGGYAYGDGCGRYVVDVKVPGSMANTPLEIYTRAFDLPSSATAGGEIPSNAVDCGKYRRHETYWHKKGDGAFTSLGSASYKGSWSSYGYCTEVRYSGAIYGLSDFGPTAGAGWDTYRVATQVKQRATAQQLKVVVQRYFQPPA